MLFFYPKIELSTVLFLIFFFHIQIFISQTASYQHESKTSVVAQLEGHHTSMDKDREILIQRAERAEKNLTVQHKNFHRFGLLGLVLMLVLIGFLFYKPQKLKKKHLLKESELKKALLRIETQSKLQEQRLRISLDLYDNIGAQLIFIISSIDNLKYGFNIQDERLNKKLESISDFTSSTIYELRDTIWATSKNEITLEDLQIRISNYIDKAHVFDEKINFLFTVENNVDLSKEFTSVEGMNIHRVIQEAIHNSLKHANANLIHVNVSQTESVLQFQVVDNGKGFDMGTATKGNGLMNMQKRIHDIGGQLQIETNRKKGTKIEIVI